MTARLSSKSHLYPIAQAAKQAGIKTELITNSAEGKTLKLSSGNRFCLVNGNRIGFYPTTTRWFSALTNSKIESETILKQLGYKVISGTPIVATKYKSWKVLEQILHTYVDFPILIKPEVGLKGCGIVVVATNAKLCSVAKKLYGRGENFLVQEVVMETEYRILVVNKKVLFMHSKNFPTVTGDGIKTAYELFAEVEKDKDETFFSSSLRRLGLSKKAVVPKSVEIPYHITRKGSFEHVFTADQIPTGAKQWALKLAKQLQTDTVGIDVFVDGNFKDQSVYRIIEINANPGYMYIKQKYQHPKIVAQIGREIVRSYFK